jgi:hypothetical protein
MTAGLAARLGIAVISGATAGLAAGAAGVGAPTALRFGAASAAFLGSAVLLAAFPSSEAGRFDAAMRPAVRAPTAQPPSLLHLERLSRLATATAADVHFRLRPLLRELAAARLQLQWGIELDRDADEARRLLGEDLYAVVRPDREPPVDRFGPGMPVEQLAAFVRRLESM